MSRPSRFQRILVVDDEEDTRSLIAWVFKDLGYEVDQAGDGWAAFEKVAAASRPDLVVLDLVMPGVDGWAVLNGLREQGDAPPVIVMSAAVDSPSFERAVRAGAAGYVFKPFSVSDLVATCERILLGHLNKPASAWAERRNEPRRLLAFDLHAEAEGRKTFAWSKLVDLSAGGAQVDLAAPLDPGAWMRLDFVVPDREDPLLRLEGRVRWRGHAPPSHSHGVAFENLPGETRERLRELLLPVPTA